VDGISPIRKEFDIDGYPLTVPFTLSGDPTVAQPLLEAMKAQELELPITNWDPEKMTTVMLTGVTALVRAAAEEMRRHGMTYPARFIGPLLRDADILHISNEIPFTKDCPHPDTHQVELVFCSRPEYIELLDDIGTDIVELTGDHFGDQGPDAMRFTLDLYKERGWPYYGGGYNQNDARQARKIEHNGNKIAFIGCNAKGGGYATARGENPGAVACDWEWMSQEIARLRSEGYNVITTFQHFEYYTYTPQPKQIADSRRMVEAGANIVSGSQAHQPQGMEFYQDGFIHYGLGNLFFDQFFMGVPTSQGFLDEYVFYDNRHISTDLTGIYFIDYASARLMTAEEKQALLESVFAASGWR
jgi:poly-gamma-glutamate synthesis protein (capsule biosynthesis protein)